MPLLLTFLLCFIFVWWVKKVLPYPIQVVFVSAFLCVDVGCKLRRMGDFKLYHENTMGSFQRLSNGKYSFTADYIS